MLSETEKARILADIIESPEFKDSKRYQDLLQYLVKETLSGEVPKEITIGTEFFHKDSSFDPKEDPTVRVYLNNLRKKLDHYYLTSDKPHAFRLEIPKGRYQVEFLKIDRKTQPSSAARIQLTAIVVSGIAILVVAFFFTRDLWQNSGNPVLKANPVWAEFVRPGGRPTLVVLGDFYFLFERSHDGSIGNFVRNPNLNSSEDFKKTIKEDPGFSARYVESDFTFLRPSASWGLAQILPVLQHSPNGYSLKLASQFTVDDLKSNNIVFIGSFKALFSLHKFLHIFGLEYSLSPSRFEIRSEKPDSVKIFSPQEIKGGNYEKDFAVVAKGAGPDGSTLLLLLGFADSGVIEASRAVTDQQMISTITNELAAGPYPQSSYFTLVVETEGFKQSIFKSQIRHFTQRQALPETRLEMLADTSRTR